MAVEEEQASQRNSREEQSSRFQRTASILVAILLLVLGSGYIGYDRVYKPYSMNAHSAATAQEQEAATTTHIMQLQATGEAQATATASVLAQLQTNYELITSTRPAMSDEMHGPDPYHWDTGTGCAFKSRSYVITITQKSSFIPCVAKSTKFSDFAYQVNLKILRGDAGGITFRANATRSYLFNIGQDGSYSIYYYPGDATKTTQTISSGFSNLIITGQNQENLVAVIARKNMVDLYINKKYLTSFQDSNLTAGQVGIIANDNQNNTEVVCTQVQVWNL